MCDDFQNVDTNLFIGGSKDGVRDVCAQEKVKVAVYDHIPTKAAEAFFRHESYVLRKIKGERAMFAFHALESLSLDDVFAILFKDYRSPKTECKWQCFDYTETGNDGWETECGNKHVFTNGGPGENNMRYCPYCGNNLFTHGAGEQ